MDLKFRTLNAEEIDCRVAQIQSNWLTLLLYKDARVDQNILDETVGAMNWQKKYLRDNANCVVEIWDEDKKQWVSKEDTGTESSSEAEKGLASDSFKRACFNWGIGRELYTSPFIWVSDTSYISVNKRTGKPQVNERFKVSAINITEDKVIVGLEIADSKGNIVFSTQKKITKPTPKVIEPKKDVKFATQDQINMLKALGYKGQTPAEALTEEEAEKYVKMGLSMKGKAKKGA